MNESAHAKKVYYFHTVITLISCSFRILSLDFMPRDILKILWILMNKFQYV
jgi:hypothetical protein